MAKEIYEVKIDRASFGLVFFLTLVGLAVRISAPLSASFPLNDGGLFYRMILDLQENHFVLPVFTTYNHAAIPFAYPPLAFYLYGLISSLFHISLLELMRLLPAIISAMTIPAFYVLAKEMLETKAQIALALLIFTFTPRTFDWLIMGGGVTRSLGFLFALLAIRQAYLLFSAPSNRATVSMILLGALVVYTHPEATTHTVISAIFFYLWKDRSSKGLIQAMIVAIAILIITAPWWGTVFARHGIDPFLAAMSAAKQNSYNALVGILILFRFNFTDEPNMAIIAVLGLIGLFTLLARKKFFLPLWFLFIHTLEPRGGALFMMIPMAMFASIGLNQTILPGLREFNGEQYQVSKKEVAEEGWYHGLLEGRVTKFFMAILFIYIALSAFSVASNISQQSTLTKADLDAFAWVKENTPLNSQFVLVTQGLPLNDASSEWFPVLSERASLITIFGYEWVNDGRFGERTRTYQALQSCATKDVICLNKWEEETGVSLSYIYVRKVRGTTIAQTSLNVHLLNSPEYQTIYESSSVVIFNKK